MGPNPLYCKVFVDTQLSETELTEELLKFSNGKLRDFTIETSTMEIDLRKNDAIMPTPGKARSFLDFLYYLDIEPSNTGNVSREDYISALSRLLESLWRFGYDAVASCRFEEELPTKH